jgi:hypothetical protein
VHIARSFIKGLPRRQCDLLATPDPFDDRAFQHIDEGVCIVPMNVLHGSRRIDDRDHQHLSSGQVRQVLEHEWGYNRFRRL